MSNKHYSTHCANVKKVYQKRKPLAQAIALALMAGTVAVPAGAWAATLQGVRFIDGNPTASEPLNSSSESPYLVRGSIVFQPLNSPGLSKFSTPVISGNYSIQLSDGPYQVWQSVNSALLTPSQLATIQWANTGVTNQLNQVLEITVSGNTITWNDSGQTIANNTIDFPFPNLGQSPSIPSEVEAECNINTPMLDNIGRKIVCGVGGSPPSGLPCDSTSMPWPTTSSEFSSYRVFVYGNVEVNGSLGSPIEVTSLCNYGTLMSDASGHDTQIQFARVFANFKEVIGKDATTANQPGSSIRLLGGEDDGSGGLMTAGTVVNQGLIKAGDAFKHPPIDQNVALTFLRSDSVGGNVEIDATKTYQYGTLLAGMGSEIHFTDFWAAWNWEHAAGNGTPHEFGPTYNYPTPSSKGGNATINGTETTIGNFSASSGGDGGSIFIDQNDDCGNNPEQDPWWCRNEIEGGDGGNLELLTSSVFANNGATQIGAQTITALKGNSVYVEPDTIEISGNTTITADEDVVIFGGDNYVLRMTTLKENAISAGRNIILAVGNGGTIDLRGITTKAFKAGGKIEIYADNLVLDKGVTIENLVSSGVVVRGGNKIIYHAVFSGSQWIASKVGETVPVQLTLHNGGPKPDTYTLAVTSKNGATVKGLPTTVSIDGLKRTELNLNVVSTTAGDDVITVTATSQADPTVVATMPIQVSVAKEEVVSTRTLFGTLKDKYGNPLTDVTIQVGGQTVTTDANGHWEIAGMAEGNYTITATKDNFDFSPATVNLTAASTNQLEVKLITAREPYDVWIADPAPDDGSEPSKTTWIWLSPDIWVRNQDDNGMAYQNVMYGQDNWVYVRARNRGTLPMQNTKVEVYRSGASMGQSWPRGWQLVGTANVAELNPGATDIVHIKWEKDKIANPGHYCFYARLLNDQDPMFVAETNDMVGNTFRNNNIAWRNFNVVGLLTQVTDKFKVAVGNPTDAKVTMELVFDEREQLLQNDGAKAIVDLGATLFQRWQAAGGQGENVQVLNDTEVQLLATPAKFIGIPLEVGEDLPITMRVDAFKPAPGAGTSREYHFSAQEFINGELVGGVDYAITTRAQDTDSDGDGIKDVVDTDNDNDGIDDEWEIQHGLNPLGNTDAAEDSDGDGLPNLEEYKIGTNPTDSTDASNDSDGDGVSNIEEYQAGTNPVDPASRPTEPKYTASGKVLAETNMPLAGATVQIDNQTTTTDKLGYWKIDGLPNGTYTATATKNGHEILSQEVVIKGEDLSFDFGEVYVAQGVIKNAQKQGVAGVKVTIGDKQTQTDATGFWKIEGLPAGESTLTATKDGYKFAPEKFVLGAQEPVKQLLLTPASTLVLSSKPSPWQPIRQGENVTYVYSLFNGGEQVATGVTLTQAVPEGAKVISLYPKEAGECSMDTLTCQLPDMNAGTTSEVEVVLQAINGASFKNSATSSSNEYPADVRNHYKVVKPHLSVTVEDSHDPVQMLTDLSYTASLELSPLAPEETAEQVNLTMELSRGLELKTITVADGGSCDDSKFPIIYCRWPNLSISSPNTVSQTQVKVDVNLKDAGLLVLNNEAKVSASNYPAHAVREKTNIFIPDTLKVKVVIVVDTTKSMQEEINGVKGALEKLINTLPAEQKPSMALIEFKDDVRLKAFTQDIELMKGAVAKLLVEGGGTCPEASAEAIGLGLKHVEEGGILVLVTDASPYPEADIDALLKGIQTTNVVFHALISGDCTGTDDLNEKLTP